MSTGSNVSMLNRMELKPRIFPLQFGRWTDETTGWVINNNMHRRSFKGWLDDFRVYDEALNENEVQAIYGEGAGDFQVHASFEIPSIVDGDPTEGKVKFTRNGEALTNLDFNASTDLSMTGGIIDSSFQQFNPDDGSYTFRFSVDTNASVENVSPTLFDGLALWLDANDTGDVVGSWKDKSGRDRNVTAHGSPELVSNGFNALPIMRYSGNNASTGRDYHNFGKIGNIRTVFWVWKNSGGYYFMLGDSDNAHFHRDSNMFNSQWASTKVKDGYLRVNGASVSPTVAPFPNEMTILALRTTGDVSASYFSKDRGR